MLYVSSFHFLLTVCQLYTPYAYIINIFHSCHACIIQIVEKDTKTKQLLPILQPIVNGLRKCMKKKVRTMKKY